MYLTELNTSHISFPTLFFRLNIYNIIRHSGCPDGSVVEHFLGKEEVGGSIPLLGSTTEYGQKCY